MNLEQLMGRYFRLKQELSIVQTSQPWQTGRINRLAKEIATVETEITTQRPIALPSATHLRRAA